MNVRDDQPLALFDARRLVIGDDRADDEVNAQ